MTAEPDPGRGDEGLKEGSPPQGGLQGKLGILLGLGGAVLFLDLLTKWWVQQTLPRGRPVEVVGDLLRFTHIMNPGAAFGLHLGEHSRVIFIVLTLFALAFLGGMYWYAHHRDHLRLVALSLLLGGALGNLADRIRFPEGVVDFLDVGVGGLRWPVFNVADMGITIGAILLAVSIWNEERRHHQAAQEAAGKAQRTRAAEGPEASRSGGSSGAG